MEGRVELTPKFRTAGAGMVSVLPMQLLGKASLAFSEGQGERGSLWILGMEHLLLRSSIVLQVQGTSINFRQLGQGESTAPVKLQIAGNWTYSSERFGSYGLGLATLSYFDGSSVSTVSGNYSTRVGENNSLNLVANRAIYGANSTSVGIFFVMPLGHNRSVSSAANSRGGKQDFYISAMQNPDFDDNLGWRTLAGRQQEQNRAEAGIYYTGQYGRLSGDASTTTNQTALRLGANGGLVLADNNLFATQRVDQSFAVVEVAGYENIGIGLGSNTTSHTNSNGTALITRLIPYQSNSIRLDPSELPLSAEIESIEQNTVPAWRSGVKVVFPVRGGRGALLSIILENGEVAPAGAIVQIEGDDHEFYVARRGLAFVTGLQEFSRLLVKWEDQQCNITVTLPPEINDNIDRVGPLLCRGGAQ